jgi:hypothetical protein
LDLKQKPLPAASAASNVQFYVKQAAFPRAPRCACASGIRRARHAVRRLSGWAACLAMPFINCQLRA